MDNPVTYYGLGRDHYIDVLQCIKAEGEDDCTPTNITRIDLTGHDPLMCVDDICDYIDYENSRLVRYVKKYEFTGTEKFTHWTSQNTENTKGLYWASGSIIGTYANPKIKQKGLSTHFITSTWSAYVKSDILRFFATGTASPPYLSFRIPIDIDMNEWTTAQSSAGTPLIAYYVLINPEYEPISLPSISKYWNSVISVTDGYVTNTFD